MWSDQGGFNQDGFEGQGGFSSPGGFGTPQPAEEKKGRSRVQNLVPVTVAQIFNATSSDDRFYSGHMEISQIVVIGVIRSVKRTPTRIDYEVDDMTGPVLEVRHFNNDQDENLPDDQREEPHRENTYVRVCGHVRSFQGKRNVVAFRILPVEDMNELTCHMLAILQAHAAENMAQNGMNGGNQLSNSAGTSNAGNLGTPISYQGMSSLHGQIATIIKNNTTDVGASIADVSRHLKGVPEKAIREAVEFLSGEGHIYSTIDDDHFKATDG